MKRGKMLRKSLAVLLGTMAMLLVVSVAFGATLAEIKARGTLNLGLEDEDWGRFHMWKNGAASGFDVDLAEKIAAAAGVSLKIVPLPWGDGDAGSVSGAWSPGGWPPFGVDLILSGVTITPERAAYVTFSEPYFTAGQMVLFRKAAPSPTPPQWRAKNSASSRPPRAKVPRGSVSDRAYSSSSPLFRRCSTLCGRERSTRFFSTAPSP